MQANSNVSLNQKTDFITLLITTYILVYFIILLEISISSSNEDFSHEEIKCRLKRENLYYYSVQTLLASRLLSKNLKIKVYKTIILPEMLYSCGVLGKEFRLKVFENKILRPMFGPRRQYNEFRTIF